MTNTEQESSVDKVWPAEQLTPRQHDIIEAAIRVFSEDGFRAGTIAAIAAEAGLSQPGLIHHFPNKDAILLAVIEYREYEDLEVLLPAFDAGVSVIDAFITVLEKNSKRPQLMRLFAVLSNEALNPNHTAHEFFRNRYEVLIDAAATAVKRNQANGLIRDDLDAEAIARTIIGVADGLRYQTLIARAPTEHHADQLLVLKQMLEPAHPSGPRSK